MNNPVSESIFVQALKDLANVLKQREDEGLSRVIEPDAPVLLREIAEKLNNDNVEEMCKQLTGVLSGFHQPQGRRDDVENLQAIAYHLGTLRYYPHCYPLRSEGDTFMKLNQSLAENAHYFEEKAEEFATIVR